MQTYWGSGGISPCILDLSTRWRWVVSFMPWLLYPRGKNPWYQLDRRLDGPQRQSIKKILTFALILLCWWIPYFFKVVHNILYCICLSLNQDSNQCPHKYRSGVLTTTVQHWFSNMSVTVHNIYTYDRTLQYEKTWMNTSWNWNFVFIRFHY
jgi:hypothetical protein